MPYCEHCGNQIGYLPFKCKYCGGTFCKKHRLPENHECSFELKHTPLVPTTPRESRTLYQDNGMRRVPIRDSDYKRQKEIRKYIKQQQRQRRQTMRGFEQGLMGGGGDMRGTNFLIIMIVIFSITATILAMFGLPHLIAFSLYGLTRLYLWVIFTAPFVSYSGDLFGLLFLFILIFFLYNISKNIETRFGTRFLLQLYFFCTALTAAVYILIRYLLAFFYPINIMYLMPIGLATGAILGLIAFIVYFNPDQEMMLFCYFIPVKMKGRTLLIVLILFRLIPGILFGILIHPLYFALYVPDLGGILASYLVFYSKYKYRK